MILPGGLALAGGVARGSTVLDLTSAGTDHGLINTALFARSDYQSTGSGQLGKSFLRIEGGNNQPFVQGYNTDARSYKNNGTYDPAKGSKTQYDEKSDSQHTRSITLSDLSVSTIDSVDYYGFLLDIGEPGNATKTLLSLDALQIFQATSGALDQFAGPDSASFAGPGASLVYNMDAGNDARVDLEGNVSSSGNGKADMIVYVPTSLFNVANGSYVYLYSSFGDPGDPGKSGKSAKTTGSDPYPNDGSFQEWFTPAGASPGPGPVPGPGVVPLPDTAWAGLALLAGVVGIHMRRWLHS